MAQSVANMARYELPGGLIATHIGTNNALFCKHGTLIDFLAWLVPRKHGVLLRGAGRRPGDEQQAPSTLDLNK